jgi:mannosyltransferase OCH1-like enzyme
VKASSTTIPLIIHQIYEGRDGTTPNEILLELAKTWKEKNPSFEYQFWDYKKIDAFLENYYPDFILTYHNFRYDVQRWDAIRYLILYHFGGIYADLDYECIESIELLFKDRSCCCGTEPPEHGRIFHRPYIISNAFMAVEPKHPFFKLIIKTISNNHSNAKDKFNYVLETTGPYMLSQLYEDYNEREKIWLIPSDIISPLSQPEVMLIRNGITTDEISEKVEKAYAIHYFFGSWCYDRNLKKSV